MLGIREPELYGRATYADLCRLIEAHAAEIGASPDGRRKNEPFAANYSPSLFAENDFL